MYSFIFFLFHLSGFETKTPQTLIEEKGVVIYSGVFCPRKPEAVRKMTPCTLYSTILHKISSANSSPFCSSFLYRAKITRINDDREGSFSSIRVYSLFFDLH